MPFKDSIDKIVTSYFHAVTKDTFTYKGKEYQPKPLCIGSNLLRGFTCPSDCGGCCPRFSLDYLPEERHPYKLEERIILFNNKEVTVFSNTQSGVEKKCGELDPKGRCGIHGKHPFSCDFELIRMSHHKNKTHCSTRLFGRGWNMMRVDGERGALCTITPISQDSIADCYRKISRLKQWVKHFGVNSWCDEILNWIENTKGRTPIVFRKKESSKIKRLF